MKMHLNVITLIFSLVLLTSCSSSKGQLQGSTDDGVKVGNENMANNKKRKNDAVELKYKFTIANFSPTSSQSFEVYMDDRIIYSIDVEALDKASMTPGQQEFFLRLPDYIESLTIKASGTDITSTITVDFNLGKFISVVFANPYNRKKFNTEFVVEQRMNEPVYD